MTHFTAIILGFVEGATEFLPISSSGHLIIVRQLMGINDFGGLSFDAVIQLAATLAVVAYFWRDILDLIVVGYKIIVHKEVIQKDKTLLYSIIIGTFPAIIFGLIFETYMDTVFRNVHLVALTLVLGSGLLWMAEKFAKQNSVLSLKRGVVIGFFQCLALVPGVSRSGATISGGLFSGLSKDESVRFSFLLSIPILLGAGLKKLFEVRHDLFATGLGSAILLSSLVAFVTGLIAINFLIKYLKTHELDLFIWYRIVLAVIILLIF